jgi:hypothetical protein
MALYSYSVNGTALSTTTGLLTVQTAATGAGSVVSVPEIMLAGEAGSSSVARVVLNRPSVSPTGGATAQTAEKINPASGAATHVVATVYVTTQGTLSTNDVLILGMNAFGGIVRWQAFPGEEVVFGTQGAVAYGILRSRSGTPTVSGHIIVEEK